MRRQHSRKCDRARPNRRLLSSSTSSCRAAQLPGPAPPLFLPPPPCRRCTQAGGAALTLVVPSPREVRGLPRGCPRPARPEPHFFRGRPEAQPSCLPRTCLGLAGKRADSKSRRAQEAGHGHRALREWWPRLPARRPVRTWAMASPPPRWLLLRLRRLLFFLPGFLLPLCSAFNLDVDSPAEYSGPEGSYFGFAVDFFVPSASS